MPVVLYSHFSVCTSFGTYETFGGNMPKHSIAFVKKRNAHKK